MYKEKMVLVAGQSLVTSAELERAVYEQSNHPSRDDTACQEALFCLLKLTHSICGLAGSASKFWQMAGTPRFN